jgi:Rieske 2Fe-2S family protein
MNIQQAMLSRLGRASPISALPRDFYSNAEDYRLELQTIWYRDWLFVGHDCEIAQAGDYFTVQIGEYPLIIVRDRDAEIRAFHNTCRHRGSRICSAERGTLPRFVCPYHQWTYKLSGELMAARDMGGDFQRAQYPLKATHCAHVGGYIFVCLSAVAPDFDTFAKLAEPYLLPHHLHEAKVAFQSTIVEHSNWKLVWENNRECYHCAANHPELCRTYPSTPTVVSIGAAVNSPGVGERWQRWESQGLPSRFQLLPSGQSRLVRMPLLGAAVSFTLDGTAAVRRPLSESVTEANVGSLLMFHYPSTWNHVMGDHATTFRVLPLSPTETQLTTKWLVHKDAKEGVDYDVARLTEVWRATNDEDRRVCQENQRGVNSPSYEPAPYSTIHEAGTLQFIDWYRRHFMARLSEISDSGAA